MLITVARGSDKCIHGSFITRCEKCTSYFQWFKFPCILTSIRIINIVKVWITIRFTIVLPHRHIIILCKYRWCRIKELFFKLLLYLSFIRYIFHGSFAIEKRIPIICISNNTWKGLAAIIGLTSTIPVHRRWQHVAAKKAAIGSRSII